MLGKSFGYQIDGDAPSSDERLAAKEALTEANTEQQRLADACKARRELILGADAEYQKLSAEWSAARKHADELRGTSYRFKYQVGTADKLFFRVEASGDSWEDVIKKVEAKKRGTR